MNYFTKLWLRYIYIKTFFTLLKRGDEEAAYNAAVQTDFISCSLFKTPLFSFLHDDEDKLSE